MTSQTERFYNQPFFESACALFVGDDGRHASIVLRNGFSIAATMRERIGIGIGIVRLVVLSQILIMGAWGSVAMAEPPGEAATTTTTAMNQSVTLDAVTSGSMSGEEVEKINKLDVDQEADKGYDPPSKPSLMIPARGEIARGGVSTSRQFRTSELASVPWYRSGIGALMIVLAVMGVGYFAIRKWVPAMKVDDGNIIKVLSRTSLSPKHQAVLVKVGKRMLLVGMTAESMTTLTELTEDDELGDVLISTETAKREHRAQFEKLLGQQQDRFADEDSDDIELPQTLQGRCREPLSKLLHRLRQLQSP